jgi:hypothetical protein
MKGDICRHEILRFGSGSPALMENFIRLSENHAMSYLEEKVKMAMSPKHI